MAATTTAPARPDDGLRPGERTVEPPGTFDAGIWFVGRIRTPWTRRADCPKQGDPDNGPACRIEIDARWAEALAGIAGRDLLQVLYWMDEARRDVVVQAPRHHDGPKGTFAVRSPLRPNPIAVSRVRLLAVEDATLVVRGLDCLDGTPLVDVKPERCFEG